MITSKLPMERYTSKKEMSNLLKAASFKFANCVPSQEALHNLGVSKEIVS